MGAVTVWLRRLLAWAALSLLFGAAAQEGLLATTEGRAHVFDALVDIFKEHYWDPDYLDWDQWAATYRGTALEAEGRWAFDEVARRMVGALADGHSSYLGVVRRQSGPAADDDLQTGLGFMHSFVAGNGLVVERVFPETPAALAGLRRGDVIVRVGETDLRELEPGYRAVGLLREAIHAGPVRLGVRRRFDELSLRVTPASFSPAYVANLPQSAMLDASTGYLYIPTFNTPFVADEVHRQLADLQAQGARALVLDLRGNLGGRLSELGLVLGAFVDGPWTEAVSRGEVIWRSRYYLEAGMGYHELTSPDEAFVARDVLKQPTHFDGPLAVLVSHDNSSAGEVAALVLQDLGRATIIGERTEGNVEAVRAFNLPGGGLVLVAVANLRGVSGRPFDHGVTPDVPATASLNELARGYDAPVAEALRVLKELPFTPGKYF